MDYAYRDQGDERLLELAALPRENGRVIALRTTGYSFTGDEIVELVIGDLDGNVLFDQRVKPQNVEEWHASEASGGISPADVENEQELFTYEDEIRALFEKASIVVCDHAAFAKALFDASWISLPAFQEFDLNDEFRNAHCAKGYPDEPASATSLADMCAYYGIDRAAQTAAGEAADIAACYRAFVDEHERERLQKGASYWEERERRLAEQSARNASSNATARLREKRMNQMNGLLWVAGAIIFVSLIIQLWQRGGDMGLTIMAGSVAVFCLIRAIANFRK